jgi:hypothetical protein
LLSPSGPAKNNKNVQKRLNIRNASTIEIPFLNVAPITSTATAVPGDIVTVVVSANMYQVNNLFLC